MTVMKTMKNLLWTWMIILKEILSQTCFFENIHPELPLNTLTDNKKSHLLLELFTKHGLKTFTIRPTLKEIVHELLNVNAEACAANQIAKCVLIKIARIYVVGELHDEFYDAISYLTKRRRVNVNDFHGSWCTPQRLAPRNCRFSRESYAFIGLCA